MVEVILTVIIVRIGCSVGDPLRLPLRIILKGKLQKDVDGCAVGATNGISIIGKRT